MNEAQLIDVHCVSDMTAALAKRYADGPLTSATAARMIEDILHALEGEENGGPRKVARLNIKQIDLRRCVEIEFVPPPALLDWRATP